MGIEAVYTPALRSSSRQKKEKLMQKALSSPVAAPADSLSPDTSPNKTQLDDMQLDDASTPTRSLDGASPTSHTTSEGQEDQQPGTRPPLVEHRHLLKQAAPVEVLTSSSADELAAPQHVAVAIKISEEEAREAAGVLSPNKEFVQIRQRVDLTAQLCIVTSLVFDTD